MFRAFSSPLRAKVPYATLFEHNMVLQRVFRAPGHKVALTEEFAGRPAAQFTYGQLQRDVVAMADAMVRRKEAVAQARGAAPLSWLQPSRPAHVRSVFAQGERTPSCDHVQDTGLYTMSLLCGPGYTYVVSLLAGWSLNQLTTPMSVSQRYNDELMYVLEHSGSRSVVGETALLRDKFPAEYAELYVRSVADVNTVAPASSDRATYQVDTVVDSQSLLSGLDATAAAAPSAAEVLSYDTDRLDAVNAVFRRWHEDPATRPTRYDDCLMIYTSGTTAKPKGAVHTHASVANMVRVLQDAWEWRGTDSILHVLPIHHIHGLVNVLLCSLASNARCVFTKFDDAARVAHRLEAGDITLFMAVPTIYTKLIASLSKSFTEAERSVFKAACTEHLRLMVSGSAALPVPTLNQFRELSGHTLLERYGMTEIGMALSQPLNPVAARNPGTVGSPLPTVEAFVHAPESAEAAEQAAAKEADYDAVGALGIASESLFDRYWNNAAATKKELRTTAAGVRFFDTGDTVGVRGAGAAAVYTILGRSSVDIIKSRGYKLSALEIEAALLARKDVFYEMAVVGAADAVQGECVVAVVALQPEAAKARGIVFGDGAATHESAAVTEELKTIALQLLAPYKCPSRYVVVPEIPRNATGKVNKKNLKKVLSLP
ncbi:long-chain-fatty-acid-CoA ligase [Novymonas esmeraldas]|uniref:Long-chain-fatty-acid-CoA ligase n=1 Tax=Novymonas esmeraldas TaxID=1808958 RepID=A0AAW0F756_9TRYP